MNQTFVRWTARPRRKNKIETCYQPATLHSIMSTVDTHRERFPGNLNNLINIQVTASTNKTRIQQACARKQWPSSFGLPGIEDDGREEIDEEEVLAEDEDVRALPLGGQQDHDAGAQPLSPPSRPDKQKQTL